MKNLLQSKKNIVIPVLVLIVGMVLTGIMARTTIDSREASNRRLAETNARVYASYLATDINRGLAVTNAVEQAVIATNGHLDNFPTIAANMQQDYIQSIQIAPAGVVTEIYPAEGNEAGLGDLIHRDDLRGITCRYARDNDVVIMQGPFNLFQGGSGIAIRNPVFLDRDGKREFWGFAIVIIKVPEIFGTTVGALEDFGYAYRLSKSISPLDQSMVEVCSSHAALTDDAVGFGFRVGDTDWRLEAAPVAGWYSKEKVIRTAAINMLFYLMLAVVIYLILTRRERKAERQLRLEAEKASRAKSTFLMRMSHDIRTPLNGILGMIEMAERYEDSKAKQKECREKAKEAGLVLLELVNEVLDMSKLESGEVVLEQVAFDVAEVSRSVYTVVNRQAQSRGIEIIQENCHVAHKHLVGSPVHLKRIITNIVMNAIKYNRENGKIYITCQDMPYGADKVKLLFRCRDTGIGMTEDFMEHIFEPFTQENATARSQFGGTGLGMSIASSLTRKMGGTISVSSHKGQGSTFEVMIPFAIDRSQAVKAKEPEKPEPEEISLEGYKLLVAEDNELNMEIAKFLLGEYGAQVVAAADGQQAVEAFERSKPYELDAILMDVMMPVMDGHEAARQIRQLQRPDAGTVPIIAMTANAFAEDRVEAKAAGMNEHLAKPLEARLVLKSIVQWVESYRASQNK